MNLFPPRSPGAAPDVPGNAPGAACSTRPLRARRDVAAWPSVGASMLGLAIVACWLLRLKRDLGADNWQLRPAAPWPLAACLLPLGALLLFGGLGAACLYDRFYRAKSHREGQVSLRMALGALMLLSLSWNWGLLGPQGSDAQGQARPGFFNVLAASWSDVATEYLGAAYRIEDARLFSSRYALDWQRPPSTSIAHVATHPPGATLFYFGCRRLVENIPILREALLVVSERASGLGRADLAVALNQIRASAASGGGDPDARALPESAIAAALLASVILGAAPALAVPALFALGSMGAAKPLEAAASEPAFRRAQGRGALAASLWILAPTTGLFAPTLDSLVALGAACSLALCGKSLQARGTRAGRGFLISSGALLALTGFVSFGALTVGLMLALWLVLEKRPRDLMWLLGGALLMQILLLMAFPHALPQVFTQAMATHRFATLDNRVFRLWPLLNLLIFAIFMGFPVLVGAARGLSLRLGNAGGDDGLGHLKRLAGAALCVLLLISAAGSVRGEVERLWMFALPPFCALAAASWLPIVSGPRRFKVAPVGVIALLAVALQAAQSLLMATTLAPLVLP